MTEILAKVDENAILFRDEWEDFAIIDGKTYHNIGPFLFEFYELVEMVRS